MLLKAVTTFDETIPTHGPLASFFSELLAVSHVFHELVGFTQLS